MTALEALTRATDQLSAHPDLRPSALADAAILLTHTLGIDSTTLRAHPERPIDRDQQAVYQRAIERRLTFEPIQYILGTQEFYGLPFRVTPAVLIPRPETEHLVEAVAARVPHNRPVRILDVGTGSGAIAIALAHLLPHAHITALDISPEAIEIAQENARTNHLAARIDFQQSDLFTAVTKGPPFAAIVSNPPYIPLSDSESLHPQVRDYEPHQALFSGPTGFEVYERLIIQAPSLLLPNGLIALEIGQGQQPRMAELLRFWRSVEFLPDLQQIPRVALARRR
ncbi:peptide chain release factor N(5)-glutamine methyltransferase [Granulicella tundricola]|uniref:Release factor glutamine methyltransferase n=1 Tax=Granulicella tundricola (strain ATCC BAA-1859 / DSM 23138 / MP5ACTX9) TaxID=1198114 RepID=E8WZR6_GRATM|nr:peptide chain release factor N(5)-glutamine methyltransferase [Granulicella tundricola]ADW67727.1 protein-(glutamine-N5) methyltransferase, release factor-specific [Granulicella tundricola MP5ACTX9]